MREICNIGGRIQPLAEATVPVMDRGFLFGDSVYEVMRTHAGVPFAWPEHLDRLRASAAGLAIVLDLDDTEILRRIRRTLETAWVQGDPAEDAYVRVIVTRGVGSAPSIDLACAPGPATLVVLVRAAPPLPDRPGRLAIVGRRRMDRRALDPAIKSGNYLNNVLALAEAKERGADDCVMLNAADRVTEASTANIFVVRDGVVCTPPLSAGILAGVTRRLLLELCAELGLAVHEADLTARDLLTADEMFSSSTLRNVWPVAEIDGQAVGTGTAPGPITTRIGEAFTVRVEQATRAVYAPRWHALTSVAS